MAKNKKLYGDSAFNKFLEDQRLWMDAKLPDLLRLATLFMDMPLGDLVKHHKLKVEEMGATSPSAVFTRAIIIARMARGMKGNPL